MSHVFPGHWPGADVAMATWSHHRFLEWKQWADEYASRHNLPVPVIPVY